jgi:hypothetical protein
MGCLSPIAILEPGVMAVDTLIETNVRDPEGSWTELGLGDTSPFGLRASAELP